MCQYYSWECARLTFGFEISARRPCLNTEANPAVPVHGAGSDASCGEGLRQGVLHQCVAVDVATKVPHASPLLYST